MKPFDDFGRMAHTTYRSITRWLRRNGFEMQQKGSVFFADNRFYNRTSEVWFRRRPGLHHGGNVGTEAVRLDPVGHRVGARVPKDGVEEHRFARIRIAFGAARHLHKELIPRFLESQYFRPGFRDAIAYADGPGSRVASGHEDAHIWIEP